MKQNTRPSSIAAALGGIYQSASRKFYIDELYLFITKKLVFNLVAKPAAWFDKHVVDGAVNISGSFTQWISEKIKKWQSGKVQEYAMYFLAGIIGLLLVFLYVLR